MARTAQPSHHAKKLIRPKPPSRAPIANTPIKKLPEVDRRRRITILITPDKKSTTTPYFPLLLLPAELRTQIYHHALHTTGPLQLPAQKQQCTTLATLRTLWSLNKQLHEEIKHHFLTHTHLHWTANFTSPAFASFKQHALPAVGTLSLSIADYQLAWMENSHLRSVLLHIGAQSSVSRCLRELRLVVRNSYVDLERDDQVWYHWAKVEEFNVLGGTVGFPVMAGLGKLVVVAPWTVEEGWKKRLRSEVGGGCVVEFEGNYDASVEKPRKEWWEKRLTFWGR